MKNNKRSFSLKKKKSKSSLTTKTFKSYKRVREVKRNNRKKSLFDKHFSEPEVINDKGFLSSTEYEIESRKIQYGYFDRY